MLGDVIRLEEAERKMDILHEQDVKTNGCESPYDFDNTRAKKALRNCYHIIDVESVVYCGVCEYKTERFISDKRYKGGGYCKYGCSKIPGGYFGEKGYCSDGRRKPNERHESL